MKGLGNNESRQIQQLYKDLDFRIQFKRNQSAISKAKYQNPLLQQTVNITEKRYNSMSPTNLRAYYGDYLAEKIINLLQQIEVKDSSPQQKPKANSSVRKKLRNLDEIDQKIAAAKNELEQKQVIQGSISFKQLSKNFQKMIKLETLSSVDIGNQIQQLKQSTDPNIATFLNALLDTVKSKTDNVKLKKKIKEDLQSLMKQKTQIQMVLKSKIKLKLEEMLLKNKLFIKKQSITKQGSQGDLAKSPTKKKPYEKNRLQKLIRKHLMAKQFKLDLPYISKIITMQEKLESIFEVGSDTSNLGLKYYFLNKNLWIHPKRHFNQIQPKSHINDLFAEQVIKLRFYEQAKAREPFTPQQKIILDYFEECNTMQELALPLFAFIYRHSMFLTQIHISDSAAYCLQKYLTPLPKDDDQTKIVNNLFIDDCGMRDSQFQKILQGLQAQGQRLKTLVYSSNELGNGSVEILQNLIPSIQELTLNNLTKGGLLKSNALKILDQCVTNGSHLRKLKLSRVNLNDSQIVDHLIQVFFNSKNLESVDLSWSSLSPRYLLKLVQHLNRIKEQMPHSIRYLNLSYNSLYFDENNPDCINSEDFIDEIVEYIQTNDVLIHLDLSGMNLQKDQVVSVSQNVSQSESIMAFHISDNQIGTDSNLLGEVLDIFGLNESILVPKGDHTYKVNLKVADPDMLRNIIKKYTGSLKASSIFDEETEIDIMQYSKHIIQSKHGKVLMQQKIINQTLIAQGIGRVESSLVDQLIFQRQLNHGELIFNQNKNKDAYFEMDASEQWTLSEIANKSSGCKVCQRYRYTAICYKQSLDPQENQDLIEIKDKSLVEKIYKELNLTVAEEVDIAPFICGTVVQGGYKRKLKMLRGDLFSILSVCNSNEFITDIKQTKAIKKGVTEYVLRSQDLSTYDDAIDKFKGWEKGLIQDKLYRNLCHDIEVFNDPVYWRTQNIKDAMKAEIATLDDPLRKFRRLSEQCNNYIYAAYLPAGLHQFLIYCPKTKRAFYADLMVELSNLDPNPDYPQPWKKEVKNGYEQKPRAKPTLQNVWRRWREDTEEDIQLAFYTDISESFEPELFLQDPEDIEKCKEILLENFNTLKIAYLEGLANSLITYPEICFETFLQSLLQQQHTDFLKEQLPRAKIELAFIRSTRGDGVGNLNGTLCRGELFENILRLCSACYPKQNIAQFLSDFIFIYFEPQFRKSKILSVRKDIRGSKKINQLLHLNREGLRRLFDENKEQANKGFTMNSATALFGPVVSKFVPTIKKLFIYSKMTNLKEKEEETLYFSLKYVEFLEMVCRVSLTYYENMKILIDSGEVTGQEQEEIPHDIEDKIFSFMDKLWKHRKKHKPKVEKSKGKKKDGKKKKKGGFPEIIPIEEDDSD